MGLLYINKVTENQAAFEKKMREGSAYLGIDPNDLMVVMEAESGLNSHIQNTAYPIQGGYATGLIQFAPNTAIGLGTTTDALKAMSNIDQLDYVFKYYAPYKGKLKTLEDLYMVNFFPCALGFADDKVIEGCGIGAGTIAGSNPAFDLNMDNKITVGEFKQYIRSKLPIGYQSKTGRNVMKVFQPVTDSPYVVTLILITFGATLFLIWKKVKG